MYNNLMTYLLVSQPVPIPRDISLGLPLDEWDLKFLLVILFIAHIFFVNLMVGGSVFSLIFELLGRKFPRYDNLAKKIAETITVNKSVAVVLGVGPLLCINLVYTVHFYSANAITGYAWIMIIPLVIAAFLLAYLHKYTWNSWTGGKKTLHMFIGGLASFFFLSIPFIFLSNVNLMLFPEYWPNVNGFFSSLQIGNVFPRYFHFLTASLALTGFFLAWWFGRRKYPVEKNLPDFTHAELRRLFYRVAFYLTGAQLIFGPLLLFTLPTTGLSMLLIMIVLGAIVLALIILYILYKEITSDDARVGRYFAWLAIIFTVLVLVMGTARHVYRETAVNDHKQLIADHDARFRSIMLATRMRLDAGLGAGDALGGGPTGEQVFVNCAACHAVNKVLAAPSLVEVYSIYKENPDGIVNWAENPGYKRPEFPPMPSFAHLGEEKLELVAQYMLDRGAEAAGEAETAD